VTYSFVGTVVQDAGIFARVLRISMPPGEIKRRHRKTEIQELKPEGLSLECLGDGGQNRGETRQVILTILCRFRIGLDLTL